jgi:hypothetical protein
MWFKFDSVALSVWYGSSPRSYVCCGERRRCCVSEESNRPLEVSVGRLSFSICRERRSPRYISGMRVSRQLDRFGPTSAESFISESARTSSPEQLRHNSRSARITGRPLRLGSEMSVYRSSRMLVVPLESWPSTKIASCDESVGNGTFRIAGGAGACAGGDGGGGYRRDDERACAISPT